MMNTHVVMFLTLLLYFCDSYWNYKELCGDRRCRQKCSPYQTCVETGKRCRGVPCRCSKRCQAGGGWSSWSAIGGCDCVSGKVKIVRKCKIPRTHNKAKNCRGRSW